MITMSATEVFIADGCVDPFLQQATLLIQTYWNTMRDITNKDLLLTSKDNEMPHENFQIFHIQTELKVPVVVDLPESREDLVPVQVTPGCWQEGCYGSTVRTMHEGLYLAALVAAYNKNLLMVTTQQLRVMESQKEMTKLAELKESVAEFSKIINEILEFYSAHAVGTEIDCPTIEDLKRATGKVCGIKQELISEELHYLFAQHVFKTTREEILFATLGLTSQAGSWFFEMDYEIKAHRDFLSFLWKLFLSTEEELREKPGLLDDYSKDSLIRALLEFGFTEERANTICKSIPVGCITLQSPSFWATRFVTQSLHYHPLLQSLPLYPCKPEKTDEWFTVEIPLDQRIEHDEDLNEFPTWPVQMMNVASSTGEQLVQDFIHTLTEDNSDCELFFHGTSSVDAVSVVEYGISMTNGSRVQDFSCGDGFYLCKDFENAKNWAQAGRGGHHAVIVFKVKKGMLDADKEGGLNLYTDINKWQKIVSLCRSFYRNKRLKQELLQGVKFIHGPPCINPSRFDDVTGLIYDDKNSQLCIRDEDLAERFSAIKNFCCVLFY